MEIEDFGLHDNPVDWPVIHVKTTADGSAVHGRQDLLLGRKRSRDGGADGIFAEWHWNGETLAAANDRFGFFPLYYFASNSEIAVSPSVEKLIVAGPPPAPHYEALAVFLRIGLFLGEETPFAAIRAVPPEIGKASGRERVGQAGS